MARERTNTKSRARVSPASIPIVILAGGRGTRLMETTGAIPKPMTPIGDKPILFHIMQFYRSYGFRRFVILLGYKGHVIKDYFENLHKYVADLHLPGSGRPPRYQGSPVLDMDISLIETGEHSLTGTRLARARAYLTTPHFGLTYGDGLSDIDLAEALHFHVRHGHLGTMAAVHPPARFGIVKVDAPSGRTAFEEKGRSEHDYINGGFMFFRHAFLDRLPTTGNYSLEREPLTTLANDGELYSYRHEGYWQCMDTLRDREALEEMYLSERVPWVRHA